MTGKVAKLSNYPHGFQGGVAVDGALPLARAHNGKVFYVGDGDTAGNTPSFPNRKTPSNGNLGTFLAPFATIDYAVGQCTAGRGDVIYVLPGYVQSLTTAAQIDVDVVGVSVLGLGSYSEAPKLTYDLTAVAPFAVNADGVTVAGLHFQVSAEAVTVAIDVEDESNGVTIRDCWFDQDAAATHWVDVVDAEAADDFAFLNNSIILSDTEVECNSAVEISTLSTNVEIKDNHIQGLFTVAALADGSAKSTNVQVDNNVFIAGIESALDGEPAIEYDGVSTGVYRNNTFVGTNVTPVSDSTGLIDGGGNTLTTAVSGASTPLAGGSPSALQMTVAEGSTTANGEEIYTITGTIDIWGLHARVATAIHADTDMIIAGVGGVPTPVLFAEGGGIIHVQVDDGFFTTTIGGTPVEVDTEINGAGHQVDWLWAAPQRITGGQIDLDQENTGGGSIDWLLVWSDVSGGATVVDAT